MRATLCFLFATLIAGLPALSRAEVMLGGYAPGATTQHSVRQFSASDQGGAAPIREIAGNATQLFDPAFGSYEPVERLIYVSDFRGMALRVFQAYASGDVAPLRVINPPILGQTRANVPILIHDELMAIASNCCIFTFPLHADGNAVARIRSISWGGLPGSPTQLNNPFALVWLPDSDEVAVVDYDLDPPYASKVVFHARTADGLATPTRVLKSINTANAAGLAHDPVQHRLYLLTSTTDDSFAFAGQIRVFADTATNTDAPLYTIEGPATQLDFDASQNQSGIGIDQGLQRIMVGISANGNPANNRMVAFSLSASGNAVPVQVLSGASLSPGAIGTPFAMPTAVIFASGFDD
jgi:hypothetical protein